MRFSRTFKASSSCLPSPDGRHVATLLSSTINVREVASLQTVNAIKLPQDFSGPLLALAWSPASRLILVAAADQILVFSAVEGSFRAVIRNPSPPGAKPSFIAFGTTDTEVCVCTSFGLKFTIYNLVTSSAIEISNPKFYTAATAQKGFSLRASTGHLAVITRVAGKDVVSIHNPTTRDLQRSWYPDTTDAQGLMWTPDNRWLAIWESAGQGHKVLFYSPDGNLFRAWYGPQGHAAAVSEAKLGAGVRLMQFTPDAGRLAIADHSRCISLLNVAAVTEAMRLQHPGGGIMPLETLQVWQEHITNPTGGTSRHSFVRASQTVYPPARQTGNSTDTKSGCSWMAFDSSSNLLATRLEESPSTIWIWDISVAELRAVLMFHGNIALASWHPSIRETLLVRCEGDLYQGLIFVWDPLTEGPSPIDFASQLSMAPVAGKLQALWLNLEDVEPGVLFYSDSKNYLLASLVESEDESTPWQEDQNSILHSGARTEESSLDAHITNGIDQGSEGGDDDEDQSPLDDTFHFKKDLAP